MRIRDSRSATWIMVGILWLFLHSSFTDVQQRIPFVIAEYAPFGDAVPLSKLGQLQFHRGRDTTYKRSSPIPQLRCVKGCEFEPAIVHCTNIKPHAHNSKWRCESDLPGHLKFDETTIVCEGFESPDDDKVLRGSCGLEYSLVRTGWSLLQGRHSSHYTVINTEDEEMQTESSHTRIWSSSRIGRRLIAASHKHIHLDVDELPTKSFECL